MVNTQLLEDAIDKSGLKITHLVDLMGISRQAFDKKKRNLTPFKMAEIYVLCDQLKISDDEKKKAIFFA